jgi:3-hydroxyacyl-CoA dehydrogenase
VTALSGDADNLERLQKSKRLTEEQVASCLARLRPQLSYDGFNTVDMVIEVSAAA